MATKKTNWFVTRKPKGGYVLYDFARSAKQAKDMLKDLEEGSPIAHRSKSEGGLYNIYVKEGSPLWMKKGGELKDDVVVESINKIVMHYDGSEFDLDNYPPTKGSDWMTNATELDLEEAKELAMQIDYDLMDYEEVRDAEDFEDLIYAIEENTSERAAQDNTYNSSWWGGVVNFFVLHKDGDDYGEALVISRMHMGGDVRGNYGDYEAFKLDSFIEDFPPYFAMLTYQIETNKGDITLETEDMEGYSLLVVNDATGTFEEDDTVTLDDVEEKLDMSGNSIYAKGGEIKVGTKVKYPKAKMIGEIVSIENDSAIPNEKSVKVRYKDGKEVTDLLSSFEVVYTSMGYDMENTYSTDDFKTYTKNSKGGSTYAKGGEIGYKDKVIKELEELGYFEYNAKELYRKHRDKIDLSAKSSPKAMARALANTEGHTYEKGGEIENAIVTQMKGEREVNPKMNMTDAQIGDFTADVFYEMENGKSLEKALVEQLKGEREVNPKMNMTDAQIGDMVADIVETSGSTYAKGGEIKDIEKYKKQLISKAKNKGLYEDFGQKEVRKLEDKYGRTMAVSQFDEWAMNYDGSTYAEGGDIDEFDAIANKPVTYTLYDGDKVFLTTKSLNKASDTRVVQKSKGKNLVLEMKDSKGNVRIMKMAKGGSLKGHGLAIGDEIVNVYKDDVYVYNRGVVYMLNLSNGKRTMTKMSKDDAISTFAKGGTVSKNEDVLNSFLNSKDEVKTKNLSTHYSTLGDVVLLRNYGTLIAKRKGKKVSISNKKYSKTTTTITNKLKSLAESNGFKVEEISEDSFAKGGSVKSNSLPCDCLTFLHWYK